MLPLIAGLLSLLLPQIIQGGHPPGPGPWVHQTHGEVWPKPKSQVLSDSVFILDPNTFKFQITSEAIHGPCDILDAALPRYINRTFPTAPSSRRPNMAGARDTSGPAQIDVCEIVMNNKRGCQKSPHIDMDEHYEIKLDSPDEPGRARIIAFSVWGILRGLESFSQLVYTSPSQDGSLQYHVNGTQIMDSPRFTHRGVMLDSSRHFLATSVIKENLDLMEMNKFNVFHWHLTDDNSFPYVSSAFPDLSSKGSYDSTIAVYSPTDVKEIIEYARLRGIRVVAEFDTPGHTQSFEFGQPGLLTECYNANGEKDGTFGPINPTLNKTYDFLETFFQEVTQVFPDQYVHLGGDEVDFKCWKSNPDITKFMETQQIVGDYSKLESIYINRLLNIVSSYPTNNGYIIWQEVIDNEVPVKNDTIVHVWKGQWEAEMKKVTSSGLRAILSSPWYLNYISYGADWSKYYTVEPLSFIGSDQQKALVIGGEACMWGEFVNSFNLIPRLWPRASAVAERLWSPAEVTDTTEAAPRLQEMECRMMQRGYTVEPVIGSGFCHGYLQAMPRD